MRFVAFFFFSVAMGSPFGEMIYDELFDRWMGFSYGRFFDGPPAFVYCLHQWGTSAFCTSTAVLHENITPPEWDEAWRGDPTQSLGF